MLSLLIALLPMLPMQEAPPAPDTASSADPGIPAPAKPGRLSGGIALAEPTASHPGADPVGAEVATSNVDACLALLKEGKRDESQRCYAARAARDDANAQLARELADLVAALELIPPADLEQPEPSSTLGDIFLTGKAELVATSALVGAYSAELAAVSLFALTNGAGSGAATGLLFLAPVFGGAAGLGVSVAALAMAQDLSSGDVNTMRSLMLLGTFNSIMLPINWLTAFGSGSDNGTVVFLSLGMLTMQGIGVASGIGIAAITDLPEGAGSFAISTGLWSSVLAILIGDAFSAFKTSPAAGALLVTATANAGFIAGMVGAQWLPMTRAETWAVDIGGGVGLLAGASIAVFARAPNPVIGYGTMAAGTVIGLGAGFAAARYLPPMLGDLPEIVAFAPMVVDDVDANQALRGAVLVGRF